MLPARWRSNTPRCWQSHAPSRLTTRDALVREPAGGDGARSGGDERRRGVDARHARANSVVETVESITQAARCVGRRSASPYRFIESAMRSRAIGPTRGAIARNALSHCANFTTGCRFTRPSGSPAPTGSLTHGVECAMQREGLTVCVIRLEARAGAIPDVRRPIVRTVIMVRGARERICCTRGKVRSTSRTIAGLSLQDRRIMQSRHQHQSVRCANRATASSRQAM
jgi:hypothetical protein